GWPPGGQHHPYPPTPPCADLGQAFGRSIAGIRPWWGRTSSLAGTVSSARQRRRARGRPPALPQAGERERPAVPQGEVERLLAAAGLAPLVEPVRRDQAAAAPERMAERWLVRRLLPSPSAGLGPTAARRGAARRRVFGAEEPNLLLRLLQAMKQRRRSAAF